MRVPGGGAVAAWMVERLMPGRAGEAMAGDLLEEAEAGRSAAWCWWQAGFALGRAGASRARLKAVAVGYAVVWSLVFPFWFGGIWGAFLPEEFLRWSQFDWPYSSLLLISGGLLPAVGCVWLGLLLYLIGSGGLGKVSALRLMEGLSLSLSVLLLLTPVVSSIASRTGEGTHLLIEQGVYLGPYRPIESVPMMVSLLCALLCVLRQPSGPAEDLLHKT